MSVYFPGCRFPRPDIDLTPYNVEPFYDGKIRYEFFKDHQHGYKIIKVTWNPNYDKTKMSSIRNPIHLEEIIFKNYNRAKVLAEWKDIRDRVRFVSELEAI